MTTLFTIGFTGTTAEDFFGRLGTAGVQHLIDIRLNNRSQLAGFSKAADLPFFLDRLLGATYEHRVDLAPQAEALKAYRAGDLAWEDFADDFVMLLKQRGITDGAREPFDGPTALLCSEPTADRCHRRLVAEQVAAAWGGTRIEHL